MNWLLQQKTKEKSKLSLLSSCLQFQITVNHDEFDENRTMKLKDYEKLDLGIWPCAICSLNVKSQANDGIYCCKHF
jgi:hypothetical protein